MARPKPPKHIDLGPLRIPVRFDKDAMVAAAANGAYMPDVSTILLDPSNSLNIEQDALLHETLHAIWNMTYLVYKYPDKDSESEGESIIAELASRVLELLRRNPALVRYLTS